MTNHELAQKIDHTLLRPTATRAEILRLCAEARDLGFWSVCVNGLWVRTARKALEGSAVKVAAVTGFPLGAGAAAARAAETRWAAEDGADEIDTVVSLGLFLGGEEQAFIEDLRGIVEAAAGRPVKAILETCLLSPAQIEKACRLCVEAGAAFVKTSTGFAAGGATVEAVRLMKAAVAGRCHVKASGGIRDRLTALAMLEAGADRLGTSSGPSILAGQDGAGAY